MIKKVNTLNLSLHREQTHSQFAEDGIISKLFELCNISNGWLVEFGAFDGIWLSNTRHHYQRNSAFKTMLIEPNEERFDQLLKNVPESKNNILLNLYVEIDGENSLNELFKKYLDNERLALLSIDVDGIDLEIWKSIDITSYRPVVVIIEDGGWQNSKKLDELNEEFLRRGYNLVYVTGNFIFIDSAYGIKSTQTIHELLNKSGNPENMYYFGQITKEQMDEYYIRANNGENIYAELCGEQIIEF